MQGVLALCHGFQIGAIKAELAAVDSVIRSLLQCIAVLGNAGQHMSVGDNGEDDVCGILRIKDCFCFCCLCIRYRDRTVMVQTDVIEIPCACARIAILSGVERELLYTVQCRGFCGSAPLLYMEV